MVSKDYHMLKEGALNISKGTQGRGLYNNADMK